MKSRIALLALAMAAAAPAVAGDLVAQLADRTGLNERQVSMIIGNRTPYAEYRTNYGRALAQFKRALGAERADELIAGRTVVLDRAIQARVAIVAPREADPRR